MSADTPTKASHRRSWTSPIPGSQFHAHHDKIQMPLGVLRSPEKNNSKNIAKRKSYVFLLIAAIGLVTLLLQFQTLQMSSMHLNEKDLLRMRFRYTPKDKQLTFDQRKLFSKEYAQLYSSLLQNHHPPVVKQSDASFFTSDVGSVTVIIPLHPLPTMFSEGSTYDPQPLPSHAQYEALQQLVRFREEFTVYYLQSDPSVHRNETAKPKKLARKKAVFISKVHYLVESSEHLQKVERWLDAQKSQQGKPREHFSPLQVPASATSAQLPQEKLTSMLSQGVNQLVCDGKKQIGGLFLFLSPTSIPKLPSGNERPTSFLGTLAARLFENPEIGAVGCTKLFNSDQNTSSVDFKGFTVTEGRTEIGQVLQVPFFLTKQYAGYLSNDPRTVGAEEVAVISTECFMMRSISWQNMFCSSRNAAPKPLSSFYMGPKPAKSVTWGRSTIGRNKGSKRNKILEATLLEWYRFSYPISRLGISELSIKIGWWESLDYLEATRMAWNVAQRYGTATGVHITKLFRQSLEQLPEYNSMLSNALNKELIQVQHEKEALIRNPKSTLDPTRCKRFIALAPPLPALNPQLARLIESKKFDPREQFRIFRFFIEKTQTFDMTEANDLDNHVPPSPHHVVGLELCLKFRELGYIISTVASSFFADLDNYRDHVLAEKKVVSWRAPSSWNDIFWVVKTSPAVNYARRRNNESLWIDPPIVESKGLSITTVAPPMNVNANPNQQEKSADIEAKVAPLVVWYVVCCHCCGFSSEVAHYAHSLQHMQSVRLLSSPDCFCSFPSGVMDTLSRLSISRSDYLLETRRIIFISHTDPSLYVDNHHQGLLSLRPPEYHIGRSMYEFTKFPQFWVTNSNELVNEIWVPGEFVKDMFISMGVAPEKVIIMPESIDTNLYDPETQPKIDLFHFFGTNYVKRYLPQSAVPSTTATPTKLERHDEEDSASTTTPPLHSPHTYSNHFYCNRPKRSLFENRKKRYRFFSQFKWELRKGWEILFDAYFKAFEDNRDEVELYILTFLFVQYPTEDKYDVDKIVDQLTKRYLNQTTESTFGKSYLNAESLSQFPLFCLASENVDESTMIGLYNGAEAFVLPTRGEGWGLPNTQAMSLAKPVISTNWGGGTAFMTPNTTFLIDIDGVDEIPVGIVYGWEPGKKWAVPSTAHTVELMRLVKENPEYAAAVGARARKHIVENFDDSKVAVLVSERINQISDLMDD